jgi:hypothetical protein
MGAQFDLAARATAIHRGSDRISRRGPPVIREVVRHVEAEIVQKL